MATDETVPAVTPTDLGDTTPISVPAPPTENAPEEAAKRAQDVPAVSPESRSEGEDVSKVDEEGTAALKQPGDAVTENVGQVEGLKEASSEATPALSGAQDQPGPESVTVPIEAVPAPVATIAPGAVSDSTSAAPPEYKAEDEEEEAQNEITRSFAENEWKVIKELRVRLPALLEEAGVGDDKEIWGVTLDVTKKDPKTSVVLHKFLRAREFNVDEAAKQLTDTLIWRKDFRAKETVREKFPTKIYDGLGFVAGKTKDGEPVTWNVYGDVKDNKEVFGDLDRFLRWRVSVMEKGIAELDFERVSHMVQVHDYYGVSIMSRDQYTKKAASEASKLFSDMYPELLSKKFFINVPTLLSWVFALFKPFLSERTLSKFIVLGQNKSQIHTELAKLIDDDQLPQRWGGKASSHIDNPTLPSNEHVSEQADNKAEEASEPLSGGQAATLA